MCFILTKNSQQNTEDAVDITSISHDVEDDIPELTHMPWWVMSPNAEVKGWLHATAFVSSKGKCSGIVARENLWNMYVMQTILR